MSKLKFPVLFISHGGGPWPYIDSERKQYAKTIDELSRIPDSLPEKPKAILVVTGHWEEKTFTVSTSQSPPMVYDYHGFPEHTYHIQYKALGSTEVAMRVIELLNQSHIEIASDSERGFDHGTFVPLVLMYPNADIPVVMLSIKSSYDPQQHIKAGEAIQALREEGVLIIGSGLTYHNMRGFGQPGSMQLSEVFESYLNDAISHSNPEERIRRLIHWETAPGARLVHPREDHLIPLMVAAGAAGNDKGYRLFVDRIMNVAMGSYRFG